MLESETMALAQQDRRQAARHGASTGKEAFYRQLEMPLAEAYAYASQVMTENMLDAEACEGIGAFLEKREPKWPSISLPQYPDTLIKSILRSGQDHRHGGGQRQ